MSPSFVLDCSLTMAWCFRDELDAYADAVMASLADHQAIVPVIWPLEVVNVLLMAERRGRVTPDDSQAFLAAFATLAIRVDPRHGGPPDPDLLRFARRLQLTSYDAAYLDLARADTYRWRPRILASPPPLSASTSTSLLDPHRRR